jgi:hypothetical protein
VCSILTASNPICCHCRRTTHAEQELVVIIFSGVCQMLGAFLRRPSDESCFFSRYVLLSLNADKFVERSAGVWHLRFEDSPGSARLSEQIADGLNSCACNYHAPPARYAMEFLGEFLRSHELFLHAS